MIAPIGKIIAFGKLRKQRQREFKLRPSSFVLRPSALNLRLGTVSPKILIGLVAFIAAFTAAYLLVSSANGFKWTGTWVGKKDVKAPPGSDASVFVTFGKVELTIDDNGEFELLQSGIPLAGDVRYADGKAFLNVKFMFDRRIEDHGKEVGSRNKEIVLTPQKDGSIVLTDPGDFEPKPVTLQRQPKP